MSAPTALKRFMAIVALAAALKLRLVGLRELVSTMGWPSAVVPAQITRFCPAATKRLAAITAVAALRNGFLDLPPKIFSSATLLSSSSGSGEPRSIFLPTELTRLRMDFWLSDRLPMPRPVGASVSLPDDASLF